MIFNILPGSIPEYHPFLEVDIGYAMLTSGSFSSLTYRPGFDISIPVFSPLLTEQHTKFNDGDRPWLVISSQPNFHEEYREAINEMAVEHPSFLVLNSCRSNPLDTKTRCRDEEVFKFPDVLQVKGYISFYFVIIFTVIIFLLQNGTFCLVVRGVRLGQATLMESLAFGCIPVVVSDSYILPYVDFIDWKRAVLQIYEDDLNSIVDILRDVSVDRIAEMRRIGNWIYNRYFASMEKIALSTLRIINDRIFPHQALSYSDWNDPIVERRSLSYNNFALPIGPPRSQGFTAVVLTYDRLESLFHVLERISKAPSLTKIVVIWNNQIKEPPAISSWPRLPKPLQVSHKRTHCKLSD